MDLNMKAIDCDIVLIPGDEICSQAYKLSGNLRSEGTDFTLASGSYYTHVSLYMMQCEAVRIQEVLKELEEVASIIAPLKLLAKEYHQEKGYFDVEYIKDQALSVLQEKVIKRVNPLRSGLREKDKERLKTVDGLEKENIETYGYRSVGDLFVPHLTFTRFSDRVDHLLQLPEVDTFSGEYSALGLYELGENGTCVREIQRFPFKGA